MPRWLVRMGPCRFTIEAGDRLAAEAELANRLDAMHLEPAPAEWEELEQPQHPELERAHRIANA